MINNILVNHMLTDKVRGIISAGTTGNVPVRPILFLHKNSPVHYYLIALNFASNEVLVLDREFIYREHGEIVSWDRWQGEMLWKSFAEAFGWPCDRNVPYVREIDWVEVCMHDETPHSFSHYHYTSLGQMGALILFLLLCTSSSRAGLLEDGHGRTFAPLNMSGWIYLRQS